MRFDRLLATTGIPAAIPQVIHAPVEVEEMLRRSVPRRVWIGMGVLAIVAGAAGIEMRTSLLQSYLFSRYAERLTYRIERGPSPQIVFPDGGPFDARLGYSKIPEFVERLDARGYRVARQARFSVPLARLAEHGVVPPFDVPRGAGLVVHGADGRVLYDAAEGAPRFDAYDEIPPLLVRSLLFIENRKLENPPTARTNPVIDWRRLGKAAVLYVGHKIGLPTRVEGGSTLATQLVKYEHSPGGRTEAPADKVRQMVSASLDVYRDGVDTRPARRKIVLDYMNEVPLGAVPGVGEVNGVLAGFGAWFGTDPAEAVRALSSPADTDAKARAYKQGLALLCAARGPMNYLSKDPASLADRVDFFLDGMERAGMLSPSFAARVRATPLAIAPHASAASLGAGAAPWSERKALNRVRNALTADLGLPGYYDLDRLQLDADASIDADLQDQAIRLFARLKDPAFLDAHALRGEHLLSTGDPAGVSYGLLLMERTPMGDLVRVQTDTKDVPFDMNSGMKMELGSTAKLRTAVHYLEIVAGLRQEMSGLPPAQLEMHAAAARDPITRWAAQTMAADPGIGLSDLLDRALDRTYSASPGERFFTGGGQHVFANFDREENGRVYSVRDGVVYSVNLVFVRLMRDIVLFHEARLPYDTRLVLEDPSDTTRARMLNEIAESDARSRLHQAWREYRGVPHREIMQRLLGTKASSVRNLSVLFYAWHQGESPVDLDAWLRVWAPAVGPEDAYRMAKAFGNPHLTIADYGFLLDQHPLEVWCAGQIFQHPGIAWKDLYAASEETRRLSSAWLFQTRNRSAQDLRLRIRFEQDAFAQMTPYWRRLGFPFERLVPSFATAIGSSGDRPAALAELIGLIQNDGVRLPTVVAPRLRFAEGTPYFTALARAPAAGERLLPAEIARALKPVLQGVVQRGTARRLDGAFVTPDGAAIEVGGKTGSGDNRYVTVARGGGVVSSRAVSRTASFVFYIGDRYFGVLTAAVDGPEAGRYRFTSALPVGILALYAPAITERFARALPSRLAMAM